MSVLILPNENVAVSDGCGDDWPYDKYVAILRKCFPKSYITVGTLVRKLPAFLMMLYNSTKMYSWTAMTIRYPKDKIFICYVSAKATKDGPDEKVFEIRINCVDNTKRHALRLINDYFERDKFYHGKHSILKVQFHSNRGYAIYDKYRFAGTRYHLSISTAPMSLTSCFMKLCGSESKILRVK